MPTRQELKKLSNLRLKEVKTLYGKGLYDGASYLSGYIIELALKARICKILDSDYIDSGRPISRSFKTHNLDDLMILSGLSKKFHTELENNEALKINWSLIKSWNETFRYVPVGTKNKVEVQDLINAIENPTDGVFTWIKKRW
ncbi:MAG: HEPN domain-containing protein [Flavobacteriales bacterium]|jgi:HEPN domain-containing protein